MDFTGKVGGHMEEPWDSITNDYIFSTEINAKCMQTNQDVNWQLVAANYIYIYRYKITDCLPKQVLQCTDGIIPHIYTKTAKKIPYIIDLKTV